MNDVVEQQVRALDSVEAPDQWSDITSRAEGPVVHPLEPDGGQPRSRWLVAAAVVLVLIIGVGVFGVVRSADSADVAIGEDPATVTTDPPDQIWGRIWIVESIIAGEVVVPGTIGDQTFLSVGETATLDLSTRGQVGFAGCNSMSSPGTVADDQLRVGGSWMSTMRSCEGGPKANLDETVTMILARRPSIDLRGDRLTLVAGESRIKLEDRGSVIEREAPGQLWGHRWNLYDYRTGTGGMLAPTARPSVLDLTEDGRFSFTSCDTYEGDLAVERDRLVVSGVVVTADHECDDTGGWESANAEVDRIVIQALEARPLINVYWHLEDGDRLGLMVESPQGKFAGSLTFDRMPDEG